ncbi:Chromatin associated protein KTI12 [Popillia japonica]|uniref:Chromatin associated protein KTI12 n=1 Tax=Popillia japonica TaxID=7064 RepID=A0AAW1JF90_POPJA
METSVCLIVCIGIPGAGKTTFCTRVREELGQLYSFYYFSYDELSEGDYTGLGRRRIFEIVESKLNNIDVYYKPIVVFVDDNMYYKSMRAEYLRLAKKYNTSFLQLYFDVKLETAIARNKYRTINNIPDRIICEMALKIEKPQKYVFIVNSNIGYTKCVLDSFRNAVNEALQNPLKNSEEVPEIVTIESKIHSVDLVLRKLVGDRIKRDKTQALMYINKRKDVLEKIKRNSILIPENYKDCDLYEYFNRYF